MSPASTSSQIKKGGGAFGAAPFFAYEEVFAGLKKDVHFFFRRSKFRGLLEPLELLIDESVSALEVRPVTG